MLLILFLLFTVTPLVELWLLFRLAGIFGFWTTIAVVLGTGLAGAALARVQGFWALNQMRADLAQGVLPTKSLADGVLILAAGLLLITPGVLTDVLGLALLIPPTRALIRVGLKQWLAGRVQVASEGVWRRVEPNDRRHDPGVVEGEVFESRVLEDEQAS
mgnify:FL=1